MNVEVKIQNQLKEPYACLYTSQLTSEIQTAVEYLQQLDKSVLTVEREGKYFILEPDDIYVVRIQERKTYIYTRECFYEIRKRLYEVEQVLPEYFIQISKSVLINVKKISCVEPSFQGLLVKMKNGDKDYISRNYLKAFKSYLGI